MNQLEKRQEKITDMIQPAYIDGLDNDDYHSKTDYLSNSILKMFSFDPNSVKWIKDAYQDNTSMEAITFGEAFHVYFLQPELFKKKYKILPVLNLRTNQGKKDKLLFDEECKKNNLIPISNGDMEKMQVMKQSAMSYPIVNEIMTMHGVIFERSYFWKDQAGLLCKCRPDAFVKITDVNRPSFLKDRKNIKNLIVDLKTIAQIGRIASQIAELKYHWQDYFYSRGLKLIEHGETAFIFVFVSTSFSLGRYPVHAVELDPVAKLVASNEVEEAMREYRQNIKSSSNGIIRMSLPNWAIDNDEIGVY